MTETAEGTLLWEPSERFKQNATITGYMEWLGREKDLRFEDYTALWEWSVTDVEGFWASLWEFFEIQSKPYEAVLGRREMPGAEWFPGAELNYAEHAFRNAHGGRPDPVPAPERRAARAGCPGATAARGPSRTTPSPSSATPTGGYRPWSTPPSCVRPGRR